MTNKPDGYYTLQPGTLYITYYRAALPIDALAGHLVAGKYHWLNADWAVEMAVAPEPQRCYKCKTIKAIDQFRRDSGRRGNGYKRICITCEDEDNRSRKSAANGKLGGRPQLQLDKIECTCGAGDAPIADHKSICRRRQTNDQRERRKVNR
jgi:hypothetical protein